MTLFVSYLRVSTTKQGSSGLGIEAQRAAVKCYLASVNGTLLTEFVEVESGGKKARPVLVQSIAFAKAKAATLLIAKLDRLGRNVAFVSSLMESGVEFVAADMPHANRLMIHIMSAIAEYERELISQRTRDALAAAKARGVQLGSHGVVLAQQNRQAALEAAEEMRPIVETLLAKGAGTLAHLAAGLNQAGSLTRQKASWSVGTTHRLLGRLGYNRTT